MCRKMRSELFHPTCSTHSAMPLIKVDDAERKRQSRAASPSERGHRSERAPWLLGLEQDWQRSGCIKHICSWRDQLLIIGLKHGRKEE